jgi:carboxyl-terminal processing protease
VRLPFFIFVSLTCLLSTHKVSAAPKEQVGNNLPQIDTRYQPLEVFAKSLFYLETMYVDEDKVKTDAMITNALKGIVEKLDPHTVIMPKKAFEQLTIDTQGKFGGVGIIVSQENNKLIVVSPIEDTPAYVAGVKSGDEIVSIDGQSLAKIKSSDAVDLMRGEPGSTLKLIVVREGAKEPIKFDLTREIIKVKSVRSQPLAENILYARISSFQENTGEELGDVLKKNPGLKGMVLDMRDNPGGLLDQAVKVCDLFIDSGVIVSTVGRDRSKIEREFATKRGTYTDFPIVILMNAGSASASEIVAGALQDHERAIIMGTTSFGKGSVQTLMSLPDGSGLKLTVARYYTPKDRSIQAKGITPDIVVPYKKTVKAKDGTPAPAPDAKPDRKESDLEGHIESQDLSDIAKETDVAHITEKWPEPIRDDNQLITAFTYLRSWSKFQKTKPSSGTK